MLGNAESTNQQIEAWIAKVRGAVKDFDKRDRNKILVKAARPVWKAARVLAPKSAKPHYRGKKPTRIKYNSGNLRRSIKRLTLKKSKDAFVGPQFARKRVMEYGGVGQPTDAYYAAMIFGSADAFKARVLDPAASQSATAVLREVETASLDAIKKKASRRGIKTT